MTVRAGDFVRFVTDKLSARSLFLDMRDAAKGQIGIVHRVRPRLVFSDVLSVYVIATGRVVECYADDVRVVRSQEAVKPS